MAKADLGKTFSRAVGCGKSLKRMSPFFIVNLVYLAAFLLLLDAFFSLLRAGLSGPVAIVQFLSTVVVLFAFLAVMFFVNLYLQGGLIENARQYWSRKDVAFGKSLKAASPRYFSLMGATILTVIISVVLLIIPLVGWLFALIASWMFIVAPPAVVVSKKSAVASLRESYHIFMKNKLQTFLFWLVLIVLNIVFVILAFVPLFIAALPVLASVSAVGFITAFKANIVLLVIGGIITAFLLAFVTVFSESAKTFYYLQARGRK